MFSIIICFFLHMHTELTPFTPTFCRHSSTFDSHLFSQCHMYKIYHSLEFLIHYKTIGNAVCITLYRTVWFAGQSIVLVSHELHIVRINMYSTLLSSVEASVTPTKFMQAGPHCIYLDNWLLAMSKLVNASLSTSLTSTNFIFYPVHHTWSTGNHNGHLELWHWTLEE